MDPRRVVFMMLISLRLKGIRSLRAFPPIRSRCHCHRQRGGCRQYHLHSHIRHDRLPAPLIRPLSSTALPSGDDSSKKVDVMDIYLSQLCANDRLTAEEAQSIKNALSNHPNNNNDDKRRKAIVIDSIDAYMSINKRRMDTGGECIANPGLYVRSIVRAQMEKEAQNNQSPNDSQNEQLQVEHPKLSGDMKALLQQNNIASDELNESCLLALSKCPSPMAENSLTAYAIQRRRREMNGTEKINDPSSYIMAVLRNQMKESENAPSQTPAETKDAPYPKNTLQNAPAPEMSPAADSSTSVSRPQQQTPSKRRVIDELETRESSGAGEMQQKVDREVAGGSRVDMDYVDKCLSGLARLEQPVLKLSGVGPKTQSAFQHLGILTLRDLLFHFPRSFIDRSKLEKSIRNVADGEVGTFRLRVGAARQNSVTCTDEAGNEVDIIFFYGRSRQGMMMASNAMKKLCKDGEDTMIVSGRIKHSDGKAEIFNPDIVVSTDQADAVLGIEPVYALSSGLTQKKLVSAIDGALGVAEELFSLLPESLPSEVRDKLGWPALAEAIKLAHRPSSMAETGPNSPARKRIAFEELCMQQAQLGLSRWKAKHHGVTSSSSGPMNDQVHHNWRESPIVSAAVSALPFDLTSSQEECLNGMWADAIGGDGRMLRLLQGDVGSGKTVMAYLLGLGCIEARQGSGRVVSLLCPTQLLASQHHKTISSFAETLQETCNFQVHVELLTGSVVGKAREELLARLDNTTEYNAVFLVGTHALTTPDIVERLKQLPSTTSNESAGLALAVIDEEQRFGVRQRQSFQSAAAHSLSLSATPIPRSISHMKSGLMDKTLLTSANSRSVETTIVSADNLERVVNVLKGKVDAGSKCFWVLPRIEQSKADDENDGSSVSRQGGVIDRYNALVNEIGHDRVCHVHGRMTVEEREEQLARFTKLQEAVLVGTTVIEVGIDIPNVNILVVEDADRFGLSQLHQLRGRIGRAGSRPDLKCHCLLLSSTIGDSQDSQPLTRLQILQRSNRGDEIADADFLLRGPGDTLGFAQSGMKSGFTVDPETHWGLLEAATKYGRSFLGNLEGKDVVNDSIDPSSPSNDTLVQLLERGEGKLNFYDQTSASSTQGLALRVMMSLFGEWNDESSTFDAINTLQLLDASKGDLSEDDRSIHSRIEELAQSFCDGTIDLQDTKNTKKSPPQSEGALSTAKPHLAGFTTTVPTEKRVSLVKDDVMFVVLDVETTGLDDKTCHVIQLAAKVLGSDDDEDLFSEYILPPIDRIPKKIEELTGITDDFLRRGGYDPALDAERDPASDFRQVYTSFQLFIKERANGRHVVLIAHNAQFDIRMLNGELRRWRASEHATPSPTLADSFCSSLDTLQLFKGRKWWSSNPGQKSALSRPSSFSLGELHSHVLNEPITNSHNAVGDIKALEKLLLAKPFDGWQAAANRMQTPFVKVNK